VTLAVSPLEELELEELLEEEDLDSLELEELTELCVDRPELEELDSPVDLELLEDEVRE
jgi:hypothetical protein